MPTHQLHRHTWLATPPEDAFEFFCDPLNLQSITPAELDLIVDEPPLRPMRQGSEMGYSLRLWGIPFRWRTRIVEWKSGREFVDTARVSPFKRWEHRHILYAEGSGTRMVDLVEYELPLWPIGELANPIVRRQLERIFDYRTSSIEHRFGSPTTAVDP